MLKRTSSDLPAAVLGRALRLVTAGLLLAGGGSMATAQAPAGGEKPAAETAKDSFVTAAEKHLNVKFQKGPGTGALGSFAEIKIPEGFVFAGAKDTKKLMEAMENPVGGTELGFFSPRDGKWFLVFEFDKSGYVKDDEKDKLDADAILKSLKKGNEQGNVERKKRGWGAVNLVGWEKPPAYNPETNNLEWAVRLESDGGPGVNYNIRMLGREGVMTITLVGDPQELVRVQPQTRELLAGYNFVQGQRYAEYRKGDKMAAYGLSALVVGGATAAAVKGGLFKYLWKGLIFVGIAIAGLFKKFFGRRESA